MAINTEGRAGVYTATDLEGYQAKFQPAHGRYTRLELHQKAAAMLCELKGFTGNLIGVENNLGMALI